MNQEIQRQLMQILKEENKIIHRKESAFQRNKIHPLKEKVERKIPPPMMNTLRGAFAKGFQLVFEKGEGYIERTYQKDRQQLAHDLTDAALDKRMKRPHFRHLDKGAKKSRHLSQTLSMIEGSVLGFLGIGLVDIPLFIAVLMREVYQVAVNYGYDYDTDEERLYLLHVMKAAMSPQEKQRALIDDIEVLGALLDRNKTPNLNLSTTMTNTADTLAEAMLVAKFVQGVPIVGTIGGVVNVNILSKVSHFAKLQYKKRYLLKKAFLTAKKEDHSSQSAQP